MIALFTQRFPLWQVVRTLLLDVRLRVGSVSAGELLSDRVFNSNIFDRFIKPSESIVPK